MGDEDKQFEASHQKLEKARKEGQGCKIKRFFNGNCNGCNVFCNRKTFAVYF